MNCSMRRGEVLSKKSNAIRAPHKEPRDTEFSLGFAILVAIFFALNLVTSAESVPSGHPSEPSPSVSSSQPATLQGLASSSLLTPLNPQLLEAPYRPVTPRESLRWFITGTIDGPRLAGGIFVSACGTALDRPKEYGPHWEGFAERYGMGMADSVTANALEDSAGHLLREYPRYFRVPDRPFKARLGNVLRVSFLARRDDGSFGPAYALYIAIVGSNFLSNAWRVPSEANAQDALLRASEGFAGRTAANAFEEFWPDVKRLVFHKRN